MALRSMLDRVRRDIYRIAGFTYPMRGPPKERTNMYAFSMAALKIRSASPSDTRLQDYAALLADDNFLDAYDLIFSSASELCTIANTFAHDLLRPFKFNDKTVLDMLDENCPAVEQRLTRLCFTAFSNFLNTEERAKEHDYLSSLFAQKQTECINMGATRCGNLKAVHQNVITNDRIRKGTKEPPAV